MEVEEYPVSQPSETVKRDLKFERIHTLSIHKGPITCVKYSPDSSLLAVASADKTISIYETKNYTCKFILEGHEKGINGIAWSPDSQYLASCSDDKTVRIWNCEKSSFVRIINTFSHFPTNIAYNPRGTVLACSCVDNHIYFFSVYKRNQLNSIFAHSNTITSMQFNADGTRLLTASVDGFCRIWDCESGNCIQSIHSSRQNIPILSCCYSPNNKYVLLSLSNSRMYLWCLADDTVEKKFENSHIVTKYMCNCGFYVNNSQFVMTGSEDNKIVLYDIHSNEVQTINCNEGIILSVDALMNSDIAAGTMGVHNTVSIYHCI